MSRVRWTRALLVLGCALAPAWVGAGSEKTPADRWEVLALRSPQREIVSTMRASLEPEVAGRLKIARRAGEWVLVAGPFDSRAAAEEFRARLSGCCEGGAVLLARRTPAARHEGRAGDRQLRAHAPPIRLQERPVAIAGVDPERSGLGSGRVVPEPRTLRFPAEAPDERELWRLFHRGEYARLADTIERWRRAAPRWSPPSELVSLLERARDEEAWNAARADSDASRMVSLAANRPELFTCRRIDRLLALEEAWARLHRPARAEATLSLILSTCESLEARLEALRRAAGMMPFPRFAALARRAGEEDARLRVPAGELLVARGTELLSEAEAARDDLLGLRVEAAISGAILERHDADTAAWLGWRHLRAGRPAQGAGWFGHALSFDPQREEAAWGLAASLLSRGERARARTLLASWAPRSSRAAQRLAGLEREDAASALKQDRPDDCLAHLAAARALAPAVDEEDDVRALRGWCLVEAGRTPEAIEVFASLYRDRPTVESAGALALALARAGRREEIPGLAARWGGPLAEHAALVRAEADLARDWPLVAAREAGGRLALLAHVRAPRIGGGVGYRRRSGAAGLDRLSASVAPVAIADVVRHDVYRLGLRIERLSLDAGRPVSGLLVGTVPAGGWSGVPSYPTTMRALVAPRIFSRGEGPRSWFGELSTTPIGGPIAATIAGRLGWTSDERENLSLLAEAFREPVRDSLLSWTGLEDPGGQGAWGRVVRQGLRGAARYRVPGNWTLTGDARVTRVLGRGVASNGEISLFLAGSRPVALPSTAWASLGPELRVMKYSRNLGRFTRGHGGYFSPQRYLWLGGALAAGGAASSRMTFQARVALGWEAHRQDEAPFYPLRPDGRVHPASSRSGAAGSLEARAAWRLSARWQIGAALGWRRSGDWTERGATIGLRYVLGDRAAVFPFDLPAPPL